MSTNPPDHPASLFESLKNWGRWGPDDELGTLNHLGPEQRRHAATLVRSGTTVSLANDLAVVPTAENPFPAHHHMLAAGDDGRHGNGIPGYEASRDYVGCQVHGLGITHVDALCHMFVEGEMYNGVPASAVQSDGATRNTVMALADGVVGRGVLLDVAAATGVESLEPGSVVTLDELRRTEEFAGTEIARGDIVLVGTGRDALRAEKGGALNPAKGMSGLHHECLPWLHEREIAVLGSDGISDPMPGLGTDRWIFPIHQVGIVAMGLLLIDNVALGGLRAECAAQNRWEFLFAMNPLRIPGGTGCPVNPVAVL
ncbi:MAG: cyclase family protein [Acidimicrobiales bacterium]